MRDRLKRPYARGAIINAIARPRPVLWYSLRLCYHYCPMAIPDSHAIATRCRFLRDLPPAACEDFLNAGRFRQLISGEFLFHQDEPATTFYILLHGRVRLAQLTPEGSQVTVHYAAPGEGIGIIVALSAARYPVSAEVLEDGTALSWTAGLTRAYMLRYPQLALNGLDLVAGHFVNLQDRYRELVTERVEQRIARELLRLADRLGQSVQGGDIHLDLSLSRQDLAELTGTTLYTVSRTLSYWEREGIVRAGRTRITLRDMLMLENIAAGASF